MATPLCGHIWTSKLSSQNRPILYVIRGIYYNTMFAKWWSLLPNRHSEIGKAIHARFIMNNNFSRITLEETRHLPYCIWYPSVPDPSTCLDLLRRAPSMKHAITRVCTLVDYNETWDKIDVDRTSI